MFACTVFTLPDCLLRVNFRRDARRVDSISRDCVDGEFNSISLLTPIRQIRGPLNPGGQATRKGLAMRSLYRTEEMIQSSITMAQPAIINRERSYFIYLQKFAAIAKFCFFLSHAKTFRPRIRLKISGVSVMPCALRFYCIYRAKTRPARP